MFTIFKTIGQFTVQFLASIGVYEAWQKYLDKPQEEDNSVEVERRFFWTIKGVMLVLVAYLLYKASKKKK